MYQYQCIILCFSHDQDIKSSLLSAFFKHEHDHEHEDGLVLASQILQLVYYNLVLRS